MSRNQNAKCAAIVPIPPRQPRLLALPLIVAGLLGTGLPVGPATTNASSQPTTSEDHLKRLVVMVQSFVDDEPSNGAGIIFRQQGRRLYIVTANHVVRSGGQQADRVKVQFKWFPDEWWDARVLEHVDRNLDIAVLTVLGGTELDVPPLTWNTLSAPAQLAAGDRLRPVGYPRGVPWYTPQQRNLFHSMTQTHALSEGEFHPGHSGGALVTEDWGIVGIASQADGPYNRSSRIDRVVEKLREWGYEVDLTPTTAKTMCASTYEAARVVKAVQPVYPDEAKAAGASGGTVELTCTVGIDGRPADIKVVTSIDPRLERAAVEALRQWEFAPATKACQRVPARMVVEMTFTLK
jgi:TonB family protein